MHTLLVTGSRNWTDYHVVLQVLADARTNAQVSRILHGACPKGADALANTAADELSLDVTEMPAQWDKFGKSAGFKRNEAMLQTKPDYVVGFWIPPSRGTAHCLLGAIKMGLPVVTYILEGSVIRRRQGKDLLGQIITFSPKSATPQVS